MVKELHQYTMCELVDLALVVPERGRVNFNILHTVLRTLVASAGLDDACPSADFVVSRPNTPSPPKVAKADDEEPAEQRDEIPERAEVKAEDARAKESEKQEKDVAEAHVVPALDQEPAQEGEPAQEETPAQEGKKPDREKHPKPVGFDELDSEFKTAMREATPPPQDAPRDSDWGGVARRGGPGDLKESLLQEEVHRKFGHRIRIAEEGLRKVGVVVDKILEKLKQRATLKKKDGSNVNEDLEDFEERLQMLEDARESLEEDRDRLLENEQVQKEMVQEIKVIQTINTEVTDMKQDITTKADMVKMEVGLDLKADLNLVNTKVDQRYFETAIMELGEAIGLLGIKFQKKYEDLVEKDLAALWKGIEGKMSRELFDRQCEKTDARLKALMAALQRTQRLLEELVYPQAAGTSRCITCRRPAVISGRDISAGWTSPKRPLPEKEAIADGSDRSLADQLSSSEPAQNKKHKSDGPPYNPDAEAKTISVPSDVSTTVRSSGSSRSPGSRVKGDSALSRKELLFTEMMLSGVKKEKSDGTRQELTLEASMPVAAKSGASSRGPSPDVNEDALTHLRRFRALRFSDDPLRSNLLGSAPDDPPNLSLRQLQDDQQVQDVKKAREVKDNVFSYGF